MPIKLASSTASSSSPAARLALVPVTATAPSPKASCAALATTVLSMPPENATAQRAVAANQLDQAIAFGGQFRHGHGPKDGWVVREENPADFNRSTRAGARQERCGRCTKDGRAGD